MEFLGAVAAGTVLGLLTGLGIGGGSLLLLYLTFLLHMDPAAARGISLLFFFPAAILGSVRNRKRVPYGVLLPAVLPGILFAVLFSCLARILDPGYFQKALGGLFLLVGLRELFSKKEQQ